MCGITGFIDFNKHQNIDTLNAMVATLAHRGPDDKGAKLYKSNETNIGLGQTRLSIIDTSNLGHQPMEYKHLSIVYNGEVYNHKEIRKQLEDKNHVFISHSDTEVILHAFEEWGTSCVHKFVGMFAILIYDQIQEKIYAFRDRPGVKPFYYYWQNNTFLFSSELKAFHKFPTFQKEIDTNSLVAFFDYGYVPSPYSIFKNTYKLQPGKYLTLDLKSKELRTIEYWNPDSFYMKPKLDISYEDAKQELHQLLKSAYQYRMVSDVPVGVFLSGGYDSTSVAAILQDTSKSKIKTFTIGFEEGNNEAPYAKENAKYLGTDHHEYYCTEDEAKDIIKDLPFYYDEPFADSSAIPTSLVSHFAKKQVTVALSADGGDEVFCGYNRYVKLEQQMRTLKKIPKFSRPLLKQTLAVGSVLIPNSKHQLKHQLRGLSDSISKDDQFFALKLFQKSSEMPSHIKKRYFSFQKEKLNTAFNKPKNYCHSNLELWMAMDYQMYLENDILTKVDRATMSVSLEGREPLLDHRILELAAQLPLKYKYDGKTTKKILRDITHEYIPKEMMDRPKTGFTIPIMKWLKEDLSYLLDEYLSEKALEWSGLFNVNYITMQVKKFRKGSFHYTPLIWKLLMFQMWYKKWVL